MSNKYLVTESTAMSMGYYGVRYMWPFDESLAKNRFDGQALEREIATVSSKEDAYKLVSQTPEICLILAAIYEAYETDEEGTPVAPELLPESLRAAISMINEYRKIRKQYHLAMVDSEEYRFFHAQYCQGDSLKDKLVKAVLGECSLGSAMYLATFETSIQKLIK